MYYIIDIGWPIFILDFISNIVVGLVVVFFCFIYLLLSEDISEVILNSFALTFIIELDDFVNLFESDESFLLLQDWDNCVISTKTYYREISEPDKVIYLLDWNGKILKRDINLNVTKIIWKIVISVLLSPTFLAWALFKLFHGIVYQFTLRSRILNWTKNTRYKSYDHEYGKSGKRKRG